jgi:hypothetical protein
VTVMVFNLTLACDRASEAVAIGSVFEPRLLAITYVLLTMVAWQLCSAAHTHTHIHTHTLQ